MVRLSSSRLVGWLALYGADMYIDIVTMQDMCEMSTATESVKKKSCISESALSIFFHHLSLGANGCILFW